VALTGAFSDLVQQLLMEPEAELAIWRTKLQTALGASSQLIVEVIPQLELILGKQPRLPQLPVSDLHDRFYLALQSVIQVFTQANRLLVLLLDDLHWADPASLKLLQLLVTVPNSQLLLIGIYRASTVGTGQTLMIRLAEIAGQLPLQTIALEPLTLNAVTTLTADTLRRSLDDVKPLAALVLEKTGGNPLFVREFLTLLYRRCLIWFDPTAHQWQWQLESIQALDITDNEATLLADKLQRLSASTQQVLHLGKQPHVCGEQWSRGSLCP
jgi:predicted ATPase